MSELHQAPGRAGCQVSIRADDPIMLRLLSSFQMALGFVQFGFVAIYLSESFIRGFMTAAGLQILISVLKYIFGLTIPSYTGPGSIVFVSLETPSREGPGGSRVHTLRRS